MTKNNTGDRNTGDRNTGHHNTGSYNTGDSNTGYCNTGDRNTGNWNACDNETGFFNTLNPATIRVFNKPCSLTDWLEAEVPGFLYFRLTEWVGSDKMTEKEKENHPEHKTLGGYLKSYKYKEAFQKSYNEASQEEKDMLLRLPNFDAKVFKEISGIDVQQNNCEGKTVMIDGVEYELKVKK